MEDEKGMKSINIKLSNKQHDELEALSFALGRVSKTNLIRIAIAEFIHRNQQLK